MRKLKSKLKAFFVAIGKWFEKFGRAIKKAISECILNHKINKLYGKVKRQRRLLDLTEQIIYNDEKLKAIYQNSYDLITNGNYYGEGELSEKQSYKHSYIAKDIAISDVALSIGVHNHESNPNETTIHNIARAIVGGCRLFIV